MLADSSSHIISGQLSLGENEVDKSIVAVIDFLKLHLKEFAQKKKGSLTQNESGLTQELLHFLKRKESSQPFFFDKEFMEDTQNGNSPRVDIGTLSIDEKIIVAEREYGENDSFFSVEAKRLPTIGTNREKEYLVGHNSLCGDVERFKWGKHGSKLPIAGLIAYVQKESFEHWFVQINSWIEEQINDDSSFWTEEDKLTRLSKASENDTAEFISKNLRIIAKDKDSIRLYHFWVNLVQ